MLATTTSRRIAAAATPSSSSNRLFKLTTQLRNYAAAAKKTTFKYEDLEITRTSSPKPIPAHEDLVFGKYFSDHMLECEWDLENGGWTKPPRIVPYHDLAIAPSCSVLHYALECFEGMKAYVATGDSGKVLMFRPGMNAARMNTSCSRLSLPTFDEAEFVKCVSKLVQVDRDWVPGKRGYSLYIRPTMISMDATLGVAAPKKALFFVILSPVGPYFKSGFAPVKLLASPKYVRAFPGGTGGYKVGSNYAPTILPQLEAQSQGYSQVMWLYGPNHEVAEVGTMNMFFYLKNKETGVAELITPPLDGTILPGVTRDTVLKMCGEQWGIPVHQRTITMDEVRSAVDEGRMLEAFGAGTACIVSPVSTVHYEGKDIEIPAPGDGLTAKLFNHILAVQHGEVEDSNGFVHDVDQFLAKQQ